MHHNFVPPHGQGPAKFSVITIVDDAATQAVRTNVAEETVIAPGAHLAENTPACAISARIKVGATQTAAVVATIFLSIDRRSETLVGMWVKSVCRK